MVPLVKNVLSDFINQVAFVFPDDILIFSCNTEGNNLHIHQFQQHLLKNKLFIKADFDKTDTDKVRSVTEWPNIHFSKYLQQFFWFAKGYPKFMWDHSWVASTLTRLTFLAILFHWTPEADAASILMQPDHS